jgi:hypothetical protein
MYPTFERVKFFLRLAGAFSEKSTIATNGQALFRSCEEQATVETWFQGTLIHPEDARQAVKYIYAALGLPKRWEFDHALITLHVWLFHNRFKV